MLYNLKLVDSGTQFVKVNSDGRDHYVDEGRLECSALELTDQGRLEGKARTGSAGDPRPDRFPPDPPDVEQPNLLWDVLRQLSL